MKVIIGCITVDSRLPSDHSLEIFFFEFLSLRGLSLIIIHSFCFWANASWWKSNRGRFIWKIGFCDVILWWWCKWLWRPQASFGWNIVIRFGGVGGVTIHVWWYIYNMCGDPNSWRKVCPSYKLWNIQIHGFILFYTIYIRNGSDWTRVCYNQTDCLIDGSMCMKESFKIETRCCSLNPSLNRS